MPDTLEAALRELSVDLRVAEPGPTLTTRVLERVSAEPIPTPRAPVVAWARRRIRWLLALVVGMLAVGLVVSPVGARVADWFGFHGVLVTRDGGSPGGEPRVPSANGRLSLDEAERLVGFTPAVPGVLGKPDGVSVSEDRRIVSLSWGSGAGTVRLDEFVGSIDPVFWKRSQDAQPTRVGYSEGLWFPSPHEVVVLLGGEAGETRSLTSRLAAQTLVWPRGSTTYRLEGRLTLERAVEVAESLD